MPSTLVLIAASFALLGAIFLLAAVKALRRGRPLRLVTRLVFALVGFALAALLGGVSVGIQGYQALTREELAAVIETEPLAPQRFRARVRFPDGRERSYMLSGDELYVDARVLKWTPLANVVGLHTAYELDRVAGRYRQLSDEQRAPRTVHALADDKPIDLFALRQRYALLAPLLDAEYGSATFVSADQPRTLEVRVSTSGLLIRPAN